jgi:hypothetical protein
MRPLNLVPERPAITAESFSVGFVEVGLSYRCGAVPEGLPANLRLSVPNYRHVNELVAEFQESPNPWLFVFACVPEERRDDAFLNRLDYGCLSVLIETSMQLVFGPAMYQRIMANTLADETLRPHRSP